MATIARIMHGDRAIFVHYNGSPGNMLPVLNELLARDGEEQVVRKLFAHRWWGYLATSGFHCLAHNKLTVCVDGYGEAYRHAPDIPFFHYGYRIEGGQAVREL